MEAHTVHSQYRYVISSTSSTVKLYGVETVEFGVINQLGEHFDWNNKFEIQLPSVVHLFFIIFIFFKFMISFFHFFS